MRAAVRLHVLYIKKEQKQVTGSIKKKKISKKKSSPCMYRDSLMHEYTG